MLKAHSKVFFFLLGKTMITLPSHMFLVGKKTFKCEIIVNDNFHILHTFSMSFMTWVFILFVQWGPLLKVSIYSLQNMKSFRHSIRGNKYKVEAK